MTSVPELLNSDFDDESVNDLIVLVRHMAVKAETHLAFQGETSEYVSKAPDLNKIADGLELGRDAASGGDKGKVEALKNLVANAKLVLAMNANHITMLSLKRNDRSVLEDAGFEFKQKVAATKTVVNLLDLTPDVFAKHLVNVSGGIIIMMKRAKSTATCELQITYDDPTVEASWIGKGMYSLSRVEMRGLEPVRKIHIRARYHENGAVGRWCTPVPIVII